MKKAAKSYSKKQVHVGVATVLEDEHNRSRSKSPRRRASKSLTRDGSQSRKSTDADLKGDSKEHAMEKESMTKAKTNSSKANSPAVRKKDKSQRQDEKKSYDEVDLGPSRRADKSEAFASFGRDVENDTQQKKKNKKKVLKTRGMRRSDGLLSEEKGSFLQGKGTFVDEDKVDDIFSDASRESSQSQNDDFFAPSNKATQAETLDFYEPTDVNLSGKGGSYSFVETATYSAEDDGDYIPKSLKLMRQLSTNIGYLGMYRTRWKETLASL